MAMVHGSQCIIMRPSIHSSSFDYMLNVFIHLITFLIDASTFIFISLFFHIHFNCCYSLYIQMELGMFRSSLM